jgi:hypothetical protein
MYCTLKNDVIEVLKRHLLSQEMDAVMADLNPILNEYQMKADYSISWCVDDVLHQAKEDGIELTEDEAEEILSDVINNHDASIGISWDTFSTYIQNSRS